MFLLFNQIKELHHDIWEEDAFHLNYNSYFLKVTGTDTTVYMLATVF